MQLHSDNIKCLRDQVEMIAMIQSALADQQTAFDDDPDTVDLADLTEAVQMLDDCITEANDALDTADAGQHPTPNANPEFEFGGEE